MRKKLYILYLTLFSTFSYSQQDSQYTQYMYNTININPAYAGSRDILSAFLLHRNQWVGLDGAPVTNNFSINIPLGISNFGLGLSFINDKIGPTVENSISADISYFVPISENFKLSLGIKGTANLFNLDVNKLNIYNQNDPKFQNINTEFSPNMGAGLYLFSDKTYFGLSIPNIFETSNYDDNLVAITKQKMHYYFIAGHVFDFSESLKFKPALLTKIVEGAPLQADITANFLINDKLTLGAAYRWSAAISGLIGFQISRSWFIGYGYDAETTRLSNYNSGSHELFLRYEINTRNRITSPRFF
ncbi:type IX secretion system membrane protein PorP/SprF [Flavobacterium jejuense]|uniref:Type IX secretion system membrane protein PorP/SprF n=1 Tax=Flavobacterium jejuense TaxID=1544455 RepID=A0ABX0IV72_9FLAO|nr:type IX secretion system membrane protein PorP/SprF [Flavobacterium jejuense]NHN26719.1 type IX secretion system membrane protein PorP/SprF [Flavobacterium jejuense]